MPQPIDFRRTTEVSRKSHAPDFTGRYVCVWEGLENYCVAFPFLFDYVDKMNMYFSRLFGRIAIRVHSSSSQHDKSSVAAIFTLSTSEITHEFFLPANELVGFARFCGLEALKQTLGELGRDEARPYRTFR
jgi:hypothetical protein